MISKWNEVVGENDIVIHLGDFAFRNKASLIRPLLNGTIILIRGNHDLNVGENDGFIIVEDKLIINNLILTHRPMNREDIPSGFVNIHGHIHDKKSYNGINVSVERTNYYPSELNRILSLQWKNNEKIFTIHIIWGNVFFDINNSYFCESLSWLFWF